MEDFFPRFQGETCAQMQTRVKLLEGDADVDHTQTIGRDTVKLLGDISPQGFGTPVYHTRNLFTWGFTMVFIKKLTPFCLKRYHGGYKYFYTVILFVIQTSEMK